MLDAEALQRLRDLDPSGKSRLVERVLSAFESSAARLSQQMSEARSRDDMAGIRLVVHTLKSSSASIGALRLSRLCAEIETSLREQSFAGLGARLDSMNGELAAVLQAVRPMVGGTPQ